MLEKLLFGGMAPTLFLGAFIVFWLSGHFWKKVIFRSKIPENIPWPAYPSSHWFSIYRASYDQVFNLAEILSKAHLMFSSRGKSCAIKSLFGPELIILPASKIAWVAKRSSKEADFFESVNDGICFDLFLIEAGFRRSPCAKAATAKSVTIHAKTLLRSTAQHLNASVDEVSFINSGEWEDVNLQTTIRGILHKSIARMILGEKLGSDKQILHDTYNYTYRLLHATALISLIPSPLDWPFKLLSRLRLEKIAARFIHHLRPLHEKLVLQTDVELDPRLESELVGSYVWTYAATLRTVCRDPALKDLRHFTSAILSLFIASENNVSATTEALVLNILSFNNAEVLLSQLSEEVKRQSESLDIAATYWNAEALPLLDSCLRETLRMHSTDMIGMRRKALQDIVVDNNLIIRKGSHFGVNAYAQHYDNTTYSAPSKFDPYRFYRDTVSRPSHSPDDNYLNFGKGVHACPGRRYACGIIKVLMIHLITNYDLSPINSRPTQIHFGPAKLERPGTRIKVRRKETRPSVEAML